MNPMAGQSEFLEQLWHRYINFYTDESWIDQEISMCTKYPNAPFGDFGPLLQELLDLGATRRQLGLFARANAYAAVFGTLYAIENAELEPDDLQGLHEGILSADPSGLEGRPGSAPEKQQGSS